MSLTAYYGGTYLDGQISRVKPMRIQAFQFTCTLTLYAFIMMLMAISQASAGFAICVAEPGHIQIEFADSACCIPSVPSQGQADEMTETDVPGCAACDDYIIGGHSLLNRGRYSILSYSAQQYAPSGKFITTEIAFSTLILYRGRIMPDQIEWVFNTLELFSSPLRC